jgi:hypothetical protein
MTHNAFERLTAMAAYLLLYLPAALAGTVLLLACAFLLLVVGILGVLVEVAGTAIAVVGRWLTRLTAGEMRRAQEAGRWIQRQGEQLLAITRVTEGGHGDAKDEAKK